MNWPRPEAMKTAALSGVETHVKKLEGERSKLEAWDNLIITNTVLTNY